jgi:hypothetical protein
MPADDLADLAEGVLGEAADIGDLVGRLRPAPADELPCQLATAAQQVATASATDALADRNLHCADVQVTVDTSGFSSAPGAPTAVTVDVACTVDLSDIGVAGLPGSRILRDTATSPLDPARDLS